MDIIYGKLQTKMPFKCFKWDVNQQNALKEQTHNFHMNEISACSLFTECQCGLHAILVENVIEKILTYVKSGAVNSKWSLSLPTCVICCQPAKPCASVLV